MQERKLDKNLLPEVGSESGREEIKPMNILIFGSKAIDKALRQVLCLFGLTKNTEIVSDEEELMKKILEKRIGAVILNQADQQAIKLITRLRNNPEIKDQPAVVVIDHLSFDRKNLLRVTHAGADIGIDGPIQLADLLVKISTIPEFLGEIEDQYGDRMVKGKRGFYKEYQDKLSARSEITADTEKELEVLEGIFQENNVHNVLDAGGGEGRIAIPLAEKGYHVTNIDASIELIENMKKKTDKVEGAAADLRKLPVADETQDAVTYNWHVFCDILGNKSKEQVLGEAARVLRDNGVVVLDLPDRKFYEDYNRDPKSYTDSGIELQQVNFDSNGIYLDYPGGESIFIGYVPSEEDIVAHLQQAGFKNIEIKRWKTKKGFFKISFIAKKIYHENPSH